MVTIIQGEDKTIDFTFLESDDTYMSMVGVTEVTVKIPARNGAPISKTLTGTDISIEDATDSSGVAYKFIRLVIPDSDTLLLKEGNTHAEMVIDYSTTRKIFQIVDELVVKQTLFP